MQRPREEPTEQPMEEPTEQPMEEPTEQPLSLEALEALLQCAAEHPLTRFERWTCYREVDLATGRAVYWLMLPGQEAHPITQAHLPSGEIFTHPSRYRLMQKILIHHPRQHHIIAFAGAKNA